MEQKTTKLSEIIDDNLNIREEKSYNRADIINLFDLYLNGQINESLFEDSFYLMYTRDGAIDITSQEKTILDTLGEIIHRYSEFEGDQKAYPGAYTTKEQARKAILNAKTNLDML